MLDCPHAVRGLPRPLETAPDGCLRPIPWTQRDEPGGWGQIDEGRVGQAERNGLCLVCGEFVQEGVVFWDVDPLLAPFRLPPSLVTFDALNMDERPSYICDGAPMHDLCAKITRAHCRTMRDFIHSGKVVVVPYIGPVPHGRS